MNYFWLQMNYIDLFMAIPLVWGAFNGFRKGLIIEIASLIALLGGIYGGIRLSSLTAEILRDYVQWSPNATKIVAFSIILVLIFLLVHLTARIIEKLAKAISLGTVNRIFGSLFGLTKYLIIVSGLIFLINRFDSRYPFLNQEFLEESMLYRPVSGIIPFIYPRLEKEISHSLPQYREE